MIFKNKVGRPSNKVLKTRKILKGLLLSVVFIVVFSLTYTLTSNFNVKKLKGDITPPNPYFADQNFYCGVVRNYNMQYETDYDCTVYNMSDSELSSITDLEVVMVQITNFSGLEKLTGLTKINIYDTNLSQIDLSNLPNLEELQLGNNKLTELDLSYNVNLKKLKVYNNNITGEIDLSNNTELVSLDLWKSDLSQIDLSNLPNLEELQLGENNLTEIDLSHNLNLKNVELYDNNLSTIDVSMLSDLEFLNIESNNLKTLDLSANSKLKSLMIEYNLNLSSFTLNSEVQLDELYADYNSISEANFANFRNLKSVRIHNIFIRDSEEFNINSRLGLNIGDIERYEYEYNNGTLSYENNVIRPLKCGNDDFYFRYNNHLYELYFVVYDNIESNKYDIDYNNNYMFVGYDNENEILENMIIDSNMTNVINGRYKLSVSGDNLLLSFEYNNSTEELVLLSLKLGSLNLNDYEVNGKEIIINDEDDIEDIIRKSNNVVVERSNDILIIKDMNGNEVDRYTIKLSKDIITTNTDKDITTTLNKFEKNAKTYDDIIKYFIISIIATLIVLINIIHKKRKSL